MSSVAQVEQMVQIANAIGREVATGQEAKKIYKLGEWYSNTDETLAQLGMVPNRRPGRRGSMLRDIKN
nr:3-keto-5-aminohexanoate cleavage protein [Streptomyces sp. WAC05858]